MRAVMQTGIKYFAISLESKNSFDSRYSSRKPLIMADAHDFQHITDAQTLAKFCKEAAGSRYIGFDTEFVSENCFRPQLCLIQVSTESDYAIIDTLAIDNIDVFWKMLCEGNHITIVHAAREEFLFCFRSFGKWPSRLFDVQLAAGLIGYDYPASYGNLVNKTIGKTVDKGETRTDWSQRPLTDGQISYALEDVVHLWPVYKTLCKRLDKKGRLQWMETEMRTWQQNLEETVTKPQWRRVSGTARLRPAQLAIVKELWIWRNAEAERRNRSAKRTLADDLIVELARRGTSKIDQIRAIRGFSKRVSSNSFDGISQAIETALQLPASEHPEKINSPKSVNLGLLGQFITTALNVVCHEQQIASPLVGTAQEVRDLAASKLGLVKTKKPQRLENGWRADIVGQLIQRVLDGKVAIRVGDPKSNQPLVMESLDQ